MKARQGPIKICNIKIINDILKLNLDIHLYSIETKTNGVSVISPYFGSDLDSII